MTVTADIAAPTGMTGGISSEAATPAAATDDKTGAFFSCKNIEAYYGESYIVQGVSFDIKEGEILALLGRNGAGKSSTLRTIARMDNPALKQGEIWLGGQPMHKLKSFEAARAGIKTSICASASRSRIDWPSTLKQIGIAMSAPAAR